jgi:hypothetical protein
VRLSYHVLTIFVFLYLLYEKTDKAILATKKKLERDDFEIREEDWRINLRCDLGK